MNSKVRTTLYIHRITSMKRENDCRQLSEATITFECIVRKVRQKMCFEDLIKNQIKNLGLSIDFFDKISLKRNVEAIVFL